MGQSISRRSKRALESLARGDVRLTTPVERCGNRGYELAHERLIPALCRLASKELSAEDRASQLLDQRVNEWLGNQQSRRYLLTWREWRLIQRQRFFLVLGENEVHKEALLTKSRQYWRLHVGAVSLVALLFMFSIAWYSPWTEIWQVKRDLESSYGRMDRNSAAEAALAWRKVGECEQARQTAEGIGEPEVKASDVSEAAVRLGDSTKAAELIKHAHQTAEGIGEPETKTLALSDHRLSAATPLALCLWLKTEPVVSLDELAKENVRVLTELGARQLAGAQVTHQVGLSSVVVRDEAGNFGFIHQSVLE